MSLAYRLHKTLEDIDNMTVYELTAWRQFHLIYDLTPAKEEVLAAQQCDIAAKVAGNKNTSIKDFVPSLARQVKDDGIRKSLIWFRARARIN